MSECESKGELSQMNGSNKRPLAYTRDKFSSGAGGAGARQKRASFGQHRSASGQSSLSSQGSGGGGGKPAGRRRGARHGSASGSMLRRQASSMDSAASRARKASSGELDACRPQKTRPNDEEREQELEGEDEDGENLLPSSNADYERIRNETLLFFLDRLYLASTEGKEARTLHDLSCLFGTRDFTREMRQIVGASRNGLKKFLQSFPSLFQIEGDKVYLTQLKQENQIATRDYNKEAADYFKQKLLQFGTSLVPIRNLFGYRSQASQEVRHVSGKNTRDFRRFLKANEHVFELLADGEHVMLKSVLDELREASKAADGSLQLSLQMQSLLQCNGSLLTNVANELTNESSTDSLATSGELLDGGGGNTVPVSDLASGGGGGEVARSRDDVVAMDPYLNKRFAHLIEQCLRKMQDKECAKAEAKHEGDGDAQELSFKVTLERLHEQIKLDCQNELFLKMVKTLSDLKMFLRMHPKLFKRFPADQESGRQHDMVGLVSDKERRELEGAPLPGQAGARLGMRQHSALDATATNGNRRPSTDLVAVREKLSELNGDAHVTGPKKQASSTLQTNSKQDANEQSNAKTERENECAQGQPSKVGIAVERSSQVNETPEGSKTVELNKNDSNGGGGSNCDRPNKLSSKTTATNTSQSQSAQLRANAPPFVPQTRANSARPQQHQPPQRSLSNLGPRRGPTAHEASGQHDYTCSQFGGQRKSTQMASYQHHFHQPVDQRDAIRNYLTRSSAGHNLQWATSGQSVRQAKQISRQASDHQPAQPHVYGSNHARGHHQDHHDHHHNQHQHQQAATQAEDLRARTVDIVREASNIITRIMNTTDAVAFDCKGYNLGFDGQITLIQFGFLPTKSDDLVAKTMDNLTSSPQTISENNNNEPDPNQKKPKPEVCVFDLITNPELAYCLKPLLESDKIAKIVHDVRNKSNALYVQFKIILNNVFDTQVANLVIQQQDTGKPAYKSRYISMSKLCEVYGDEDLLKYRNMIKSKTRHSSASGTSSSSNRLKDVNYWRARPLTKPMIYESTMDVYCLIGGIYQNLKSKLRPEYEPLFEQLNLEGVLARIKPDEIKSAKKGRKIDLEVIDLKRKLYRDATGPIVLSNREIRLLRHIDLTEEVRQKIQQCKKVAKKLERLDMKAQLLQTNQLQSLNSQNSDLSQKDNNDPQSLASTSSGELSSSVTGASHSSSEKQLVEEEERILSSFMDSSSMFDELKDKMIESSNLLDSIEDSLRTPL